MSSEGMKPSEAMLAKMKRSLRDCYETGNYSSFESVANAAIAPLPDPLAVIDRLTDRLQTLLYDSDMEVRREAQEALDEAEQFKKDWSGQ